MKIGVSIRPIIQVAEDSQEFFDAIFAESVGFEQVEVHTENLDEFEVFLLELLEKSGIKFSVHCPHMYSGAKVNFCSNTEKDIKNADFWLKKSIECAKKLESESIIIHPDIPKHCSKKQALDLLEKHIRNNLNALDKSQSILIENMPSSPYALSTPEEFKSFLKRFKSRVFACWDIGHEVHRFKKQEFLFPRKLGDKIKEVHISGIVNYDDAYPLTKGNLNLERCISALKKIKYRNSIIFEIVTKNPMDIIESKALMDRLI